MAIVNENWIYDDENTSYARKASEVLRKAKALRKGKRFKYVVVSLSPLTIKEIEDRDGMETYG